MQGVGPGEAEDGPAGIDQAVLAAAWAEFGKASPPSDDKEFLAAWTKARGAALKKANMPNGFED